MTLLPHVLHIADASEWHAAAETGSYERSTRGRSLADVGFIHLSFAWQVARVASFVYADEHKPLVLLRVDPSLLTAPLRIEALEGSERFPHLYGPLATAAVVEVRDLARSEGAYRLPVDWVVPHYS